ncbi:hypothetical protein POX_a00681 [Penicillium oxalicum]|uniref:hypothetical protein n=1 Tax=Penicillium oxalicum TaxID=69781 RepID=UPI0020B6BB40|nr:hypothetical protein POX_a00681 [Penicillium oxalicum]KAI2794091.1 hypothetical protein POX_a00681 [Penicillium oxalicum]
MTDSTPRKRSRAACLSCQSRKRKCSGEQPCSTCAQAGVACVFSDLPRKKRARRPSIIYRTSLAGLNERLGPSSELEGRVPPASTARPASGSVAGSAPSPGSQHYHFHQPRISESRPASHSLEANSGAAFVRKLGLRIDPARAPRLHLFAWNVGERRLSRTASSTPSADGGRSGSVVQILLESEMHRLAGIYFEKVHPCYAFLDQGIVSSRISQRWSSATSPMGTSGTESIDQPYDVVLLGIAALGLLFSCREMSSQEIWLVDTARSLLEKSILGAESPTIDTVTGWVLRTAYLRMTASPHAAWMASCTLMHLIEAASLHIETSNSESLPPPPPSSSSSTPDTNLRRRLFGMARHLNTWISFDLGRSRVPRPAGPTPQDLPELETALTAVLDLSYTEPSLILVQCNLMLCIYRRVRALNAHAPLPGRALDRILELGERGLHAARSMVAATSPWHQVANVPFQVLCILLAIDSRAALALLPQAMITLREVLVAYDTDVMREAYSTAYLLIALHQRRKEDDTRALAEVLRANAAAAVPASLPVVARRQEAEKVKGDEARTGRSMAMGMGMSMSISTSTRDGEGSSTRVDSHTIPRQARAQDVLGPVSDAELSWLGDLMIDMPSLQNFDLDQFLLTDVPWPLPEMGI